MFNAAVVALRGHASWALVPIHKVVSRIALTAIAGLSVAAAGGAFAQALTPVPVTPPHIENPDAGTLPGSLGVSAGGAATYGIPIDVPPGTAGLQPKLSLNYSSQSTNGLVGLGWSLGGFSSIHRCGKTIAQDSINGRIRFDQGDRLCLDGQRLVLVNKALSDANYWADDAEYRTEIDSFSRITALVTNGNRSFKVETKDGRVMTYGSTPSSYVLAVVRPPEEYKTGLTAPKPTAKSGPLSWAVDRIADRADNYISFAYEQDSTTGEHRATFIRYGGASLPAHAAVQFVYEGRPDAWKRYVDEARNDLRSRVASIKTYVGTNLDGDVVAGGTLVRDYTLQYERSPTSGRSLLNAVQACARHPSTGVVECLPKTTFTWGKPDPSKTAGFVSRGVWPGAPILTTHITDYSARHPEYFAFTDFGNDGYTDVLEKRVASPTSPATGPDAVIEDANPIPRGTLRTQYRYFHNNRSGFTQYNYALNTGEAFAVLQVGDFDGDGAPDLHVSTAAGPKICLSPLGTVGALGAPGTTITFTCDPNRPAVGGNDAFELPYVVDVVGDGRSTHYSKIDATTLDATLCLQTSPCITDTNPPDVLGLTHTQYGTPLIQINNYFRYEESVDFAGTGKPAAVRWTKPHYQKYRYDEDGSQIYVNRWENKQPQVIMTGFRVPGSTYTDSSLYAYSYPSYNPTCDHAGCTPYTFEGGGEAADFNGSGYSSLAFGFLELRIDQTGLLSYSRAEMTLCLSTGRALDCGIRKKYSGANYMSGGSAGNYVGDGLPTFLGVPVTQGPNGPIAGTAQHMCRVMGDDTTGGEGTDDANIACDPWSGPVLSGRNSVHLMDLLGTGRTQQVVYHSGYFDANHVWQEDGRWELFEPLDVSVSGQALDRIYRVTNGLGATSAVEYVDALPSGVGTRTSANQLTYPQRATSGVGKIVSRLRVGNGVSADRTTTYRYQNPAIDVGGRGSLGFATVISTDDQTGIVTTTNYAQAWPLTGMALSSTVAAPGGTVLLSETSNRLRTKAIGQAYGTGTVCPFIVHSVVRRRDLDGSDLGTVTTSGVDTDDVQYDDWCNLLKSKVVSAGSAVDAEATFTTTGINTYLAPDIAHWLVGLVHRSSVTKSQRGDDRSITRTTEFTYEPNYTGRVESETLQPDDATLTQRLKTTYDRSGNSFGLVKSKTVTWRDLHLGSDKSRTDSMVYDANGRFPVSVTNALDHTETRAHDAGTGAQTRLTGPSNLSTRWTVDGFGRATVELRADGNEARKYTKQCQGDCPAGAALAVISDSFHGADRIAVPQVMYVDSAGHALRTMTWGFDGREILTDQRYDALGRLEEADQPRYSSDAAYRASRQSYDVLNRVTAVTTRDEAGTDRAFATEYHGMVTTITNAKGQKRTDKRDVLGLLREVIDPKLGVTQFGYEPFGNLSRTVDPNGNVITVSYDDMGRKTDLSDPNLGSIHYDVDALGQTWRQINPVQRSKSQSTRFEFDLLGRMTGRYEPDLESHWVFDTAANGIGQLAEAFTGTPSTKDYRRLHTYDALGRPSTTTLALTDANYTSTPEYDAWSRVVKQTHRRGADAAKAFDMRYNNHGYPSQIERAGLALWKLDTQDAAQRVTQASLGNGLSQTRGFNAHTGRIDSAMLQTTGQLARLQEGYQYDALGNVTRRTQYWDANGFIEDFGYDELNRLTSSQVVGQAPQAFAYDAAGNLTSKTGLGSFDYGAVRTTFVMIDLDDLMIPVPIKTKASTGWSPAHGVSHISGLGAFSYDENGNLVSGAGRTITWTSFDMPVTITKGAISSTFAYGPEHQRAKQVRSDGAVIIYAGSQEVENKAGQITVKTYWPNGLGVEIDRPGAGTELNWTHVDRLGSPVAITDSAGNLAEKLAYDAWGKRRTTDGSATPDSLDGVVDNKGFTKHEMLDQLDLVHMNGRVYDPLTARFLSGDPVIQDPLNGQNYSRYTYVFNNPTNLTDPTGFCVKETGTNLCGSAVGRTIEGGLSRFEKEVNEVERKIKQYSGEARQKLEAQFKQVMNNLTNKVDAKGSGAAPASSSGAAEIAGNGLRFARQATERILGALPAAGQALLPTGEEISVLTGVGTLALAEPTPFGEVGLLATGVAVGLRGLGRAADKIFDAVKGVVNGCCCFAAGTPVLTANGPRPIEDVVVGELVYAKDPTTGDIALKPVVQLIHTEGKLLHQLTLRNARGAISQMEVTDNHPYWVKGRGWVDSAKLRPGMRIDSYDGTALTVVRLRPLKRTEKTYNFTVGDYESYFAGSENAFVHNCSCALPAKGAAGETRFINGVKVTDLATGNVLQGTVDLKPTLDRISAGKSFPHKNDGSVFGNKEGLLPQQPAGYYREYVHPTPGVNGPGPQRIVTGQGGEIFYTPDHYGTFIRVNP